MSDATTLPVDSGDNAAAAPAIGQAASAPASAPPVGLMSEQMGNVDTEQPGTALFPATAWEGQDWLGLSKQVVRGLGNIAAEYGTVDNFGQPISQPEPTISAADANKQSGIPGKLTFSGPLPASVAQSMNDAKTDEIAREDAASRAPDGFWPTAARMGAGFVAGALDPLNVAAAFVPTLGEARLAGMLARVGVPGLEGVAEGGAAAISSTLGRAAFRGAQGYADNLAGVLPLNLLHYGLSRQEQGDYSAVDALADSITMPFLGAALHAGGGVAGDLLSQRFARSAAGATVAADPDAAEAAMRAAVSATVEGRPVEVAPVLDSAMGQSAINELMGWATRHDAVDQDVNATPPAPPIGIADHGTAIASASEHLGSLQAESEQLHGDVADAQTRVIRAAMDPDTSDRLGSIEDELSGVMPSARRRTLTAEREMLLQGRGWQDVGASADTLEVARTRVEMAGLSRAAERTDAQADVARDQLQTLRQEASQAAALAGRMSESAARAQAVTRASAEGKAAVLRSLTSRTLRRFAGRVGAALEPGEADRMAGDILGSTLDEAPDQIRSALSAIGARRKAAILEDGDATPSPAGVVQNGMARIRAAMGGANSAFDRAAAYAHGEPLPEETTITRMADAATAGRKPDLPGGLPAAADLQTQMAEDALQRAGEAGLLGVAERAEMDAANGWLDQAAAYGKGVLQAAACIARGLA